MTISPTPVAAGPDLTARLAAILEGLIEDIAVAETRRWSFAPLILWLIRPYLRGIIEDFRAAVDQARRSATIRADAAQAAPIPVAAPPPTAARVSVRREHGGRAALRAAPRELPKTASGKPAQVASLSGSGDENRAPVTVAKRPPSIHEGSRWHPRSKRPLPARSKQQRTPIMFRLRYKNHGQSTPPHRPCHVRPRGSASPRSTSDGRQKAGGVDRAGGGSYLTGLCAVVRPGGRPHGRPLCSPASPAPSSAPAMTAR